MPEAFLWDTCVLYRWLNGQPIEYLDHIEAFLKDSISGKVDLYLSTISLAEIRPSSVGKSDLTPTQIISGIRGSFTLIDPTPDIMSLAGYLRDFSYRHVDLPDSKEASRPLGTGDAIQIATAVALREEFGVQSLGLHTFDEGKKKDGVSGKKSVPIIGFEKWCKDCMDDEEVQKVISLPRKKPEHPSCPLPMKNPNSTSLKKPPAS